MLKTNSNALYSAYKKVVLMLFLVHFCFSIILWREGITNFALYNVFSAFYYLCMGMLLKNHISLVTSLTHIEICFFVTIGTILFGVDSGFCIYLIALSALNYFNPFQKKRWIYTFSLIEVILFFVLQTTLRNEAGLIPLREELYYFYSYLNYALCFFAVIMGAVIAGVSAEHLQSDWYKTYFDELTGIYNSRYFEKKVEEIFKSDRKEYYLISTDIYGFKFFNELFGEDKGDEVLKIQADMLRDMEDSCIVYGRLAADEFAMLIPVEAFSEEQLKEYANVLKNRFSNELYQIHIYMGIYRIENLEEHFSHMLTKTRVAIDTIKGSYSRNLVYFDEGMLQESVIKKKIIGEFENALQERQFCIYLQPQVIEEGKVLGAEALVRWQHPDKGVIPPGLFLPTLEEAGVITILDCFVWEEAAKLLHKWKEAGMNQLYISVNVSGIDFRYVDIYRFFTSLVEKYDINPANLKIEITETTLMEDLKNRNQILNQLKEYGFEIEMDDFGSGYSSLNALKDIMVDVIKLDMGFLGETMHEKRAWCILDNIVNMAESLRIRIITEGVETEHQVKKMADIGCKVFQGYYFAKPMPVEEFTKKYLQS